MIAYEKASQVTCGLVGRRPVLINEQGGRVAIDAKLLELWRAADGHTADQVVTAFKTLPADAVRAALACLAEAGFLTRADQISASPPLFIQGPLVSVIVVAFNSREWLDECLSSLQSQTYQPVEIIVVDNASSDGAAEWLAQNYPQIRLVHLDSPQSFACATNLGIHEAKGEYFFVLNPDVKVQSDALAQLVAIACADPVCAAVAPKLKYWWATAFLNGIGNRVRAVSWGTDNAIGHLDVGQFDDWDQLPSACFAAALIVRSVWERVGALDEKFPMYYEDSEWSYRARLLGYTIRAAPRAVVFHALGGRIPSGETSELAPRKLRNVVYGRLRFAAKILGVGFLAQFMRNFALEDGLNLAHALVRGKWAVGGAYLGGWIDFLKTVPALRHERAKLQSQRVQSDKQMFALQADMPGALIWHGLPDLSWDQVIQNYLPLILSKRTRPMPEFQTSPRRPHLLIVSNDVVDAKMGGAGMRYVEMARALTDDLDVTLAVPSETSVQLEEIQLVRYWEERPASLQVLVENSDVALVSGYMVQKFPFLSSTRARLVIDLYDPFFLENLFYYLDEPIDSQERLNDHALTIVNQLAQIGDYFICGSERQRDFWLGVLVANKRVNPRTFARDQTLRALIDVVGVGFSDRAPRHQPILRGVHPAFPQDSRIVLWGGGIWNWLDPLTLIRAWHQVVARYPNARLVFLGTRHPNPLVPTHRVAQQAVTLAQEIGEKDRTIFFFEWLPYSEREALLCEADIGVTLHPPHIETRFSIRTRILDYLWARLPVLISDGDVTSEWVRQYNVGMVVPPLDAKSVADAIAQMLDQPKDKWSAAFEPLRDVFRWHQVVAPLRKYCLRGVYAPDRQSRDAVAPMATERSWRTLLSRGLSIWRTEGIAILVHRVKRYIQWRMSSI